MKTVLPLSSATELLEKEFGQQRSPDCHICVVPKLFWGPAPAGIGGLWYLKALPPCMHGCHTIVARIWVGITNLHDIEYSPPRPTGKTRREGMSTRAFERAIAGRR